MAIRLFGFEIRRSSEQELERNSPSFAPPPNDDGAVIVQATAAGGAYATYLDLDGTVKTEAELVTKYREMALHPEIDYAMDEITNEAVVIEDGTDTVSIDFDAVPLEELPPEIRDVLVEEFKTILDLLDYNRRGYDVFRDWYRDGRTQFHVVIDQTAPKEGIKELRYMDPRRIRKVREVQKQTDVTTGASIQSTVNEYFVYNEKGFGVTAKQDLSQYAQGQQSMQVIKIAKDSVVQVTSGISDAKGQLVLSHLHKAMKPLNQLRNMEDATIIYRLARSPERRIFYIDVGALPKVKAEQHLRDVMTKHKNRLVYDACLDMDTRVPLLDGRTLTIREIAGEVKQGRRLWAYSAHPETGKFAPGLISWAGVTREDATVMRVTLDNGKAVTCTPDHKFPVWNKGKTEAKDLCVGDSLIPFYTRENTIHSSRSTYEQVFDHESQKWDFTHRLVSRWKDSVDLPNEWVCNEEYVDSRKQTVHHLDYSRRNNSPENLVRMNRDDHLFFHHRHNGIAGKVGGPIGAAKQKELGIGIFGLSTEQRQEIGRWSGSLGGKKSFDNRSGIHDPTNKHVYALIGSTALCQKLFTDSEFKAAFGQAIRDGWGQEQRDAASARGKQRSVDHFKSMNALANESRWNGANSVENRTAHSQKQQIDYTDEIEQAVRAYASQKYSIEKVVEAVNSTVDLSAWRAVNFEKNVKLRDVNTMVFTYKDLLRLCKNAGYKDWREYRTATTYHNHKVVKIEVLSEGMDVGTLSIDRDEVYHDYHTFALDSGIYICNSTGEVRDDRKFMTMLEDYWFARREGSLGTKVENLPGGQNLGVIEDVEMFRQKLYRSLNIPLSRLSPDQAVFSIGRASEVSRDEVKFTRFIDKLRVKFSDLFLQCLEKQVVLKQIMSVEEWDAIEARIKFRYAKDSHFEELKMLEVWRERTSRANEMIPLAGAYYSHAWIRKNILKQTEEEMEEMDMEMDAEEGDPRYTKLGNRFGFMENGMGMPGMGMPGMGGGPPDPGGGPDDFGPPGAGSGPPPPGGNQLPINSGKKPPGKGP